MGEKNPWHVVPVQERQEPSLAVLLGGCVPSYRNTNEKTMMVQGLKSSWNVGPSLTSAAVFRLLRVSVKVSRITLDISGNINYV